MITTTPQQAPYGAELRRNSTTIDEPRSPSGTPRAARGESRRSSSSQMATPVKLQLLRSDTPTFSRVSGTPSADSKRDSFTDIPGTPDGVSAKPEAGAEVLMSQLLRALRVGMASARSSDELVDRYVGGQAMQEHEQQAARNVMTGLGLQASDGAKALMQLRNQSHAMEAVHDFLQKRNGTGISSGQAVVGRELAQIKQEHGRQLPLDVKNILDKLVKTVQGERALAPVRAKARIAPERSAPGKVESPREKPPAKELPGLAAWVKRNTEALDRWATTGDEKAAHAVAAFRLAVEDSRTSGDISRLMLPLLGAPDYVRRLQHELQVKFVQPQRAALEKLTDALDKRISDVMTSMTQRNLDIEKLGEQIDAQFEDEDQGLDTGLSKRLAELQRAAITDRNLTLPSLQRVEHYFLGAHPIDLTSINEKFPVNQQTVLGREARECMQALVAMAEQAGESVSRWSHEPADGKAAAHAGDGEAPIPAVPVGSRVTSTPVSLRESVIELLPVFPQDQPAPVQDLKSRSSTPTSVPGNKLPAHNVTTLLRQLLDQVKAARQAEDLIGLDLAKQDAQLAEKESTGGEKPAGTVKLSPRRQALDKQFRESIDRLTVLTVFQNRLNATGALKLTGLEHFRDDFAGRIPGDLKPALNQLIHAMQRAEAAQPAPQEKPSTWRSWFRRN